MDTPSMLAQRMVKAVKAVMSRMEASFMKRMEEVHSNMRAEVAKAISEIPIPKDGKNGESVHPDTVKLMVKEEVEKAVLELPKPKDGKDAIEITVLPGIDETRSYPAGTYAKYNGGEIRAVRRTDPIKDGDFVAAGWSVAREGVSAIVVTQGDDQRTISVATLLTSGTKAVSDFSVPVLIYRDVWREGTYQRGDVVTWGGSAWHCQEQTTDKPGISKAWKLMVKEGRPGKDAGDNAPRQKEPVRLR